MKFICVFCGLFMFAAAAPTTFRWTDCSSDPNTRVLTVQSLTLNPSIVTFPGTVNVSINVTINKDIDFLFIDTELFKKTALAGLVKLPCIGTTNISSCQNIDACTLLSTILNGSSVVSKSLGQQVDTILYNALGYHTHYPMHPELILVDNKQLNPRALPTILGLIADGDYHVKISVKDDPTSTENLGCIEFDAGVRRGSPGVPVGK